MVRSCTNLAATMLEGCDCLLDRYYIVENVVVRWLFCVVVGWLLTGPSRVFMIYNMMPIWLLQS